MRNAEMYRPVSYGANHILNRVLSDPKRIPGGADELLEKIVRTAQNTAQNYNAIYKEGNRFIIYDGKNSLVVSPDKDEMSIITMYTQENPQKRYGNPCGLVAHQTLPSSFSLCVAQRLLSVKVALLAKKCLCKRSAFIPHPKSRMLKRRQLKHLAPQVRCP
jgi:hypothetical protein